MQDVNTGCDGPPATTQGAKFSLTMPSMVNSENGKAAAVAVYGTPDQLALLLASIVQIVEHEPDSSYEDDEVRTVARRLAGTIHERLAATSAPTPKET